MIVTWSILVLSIIYSSIFVSSLKIDSIFLDLVHRNLSDFASLNNIYRNILENVRQHRSIDIVQSPINVSKIRFNNYDQEYLKNACYETASDLLLAHGYTRNDTELSKTDVQSLLPAILYSIENPGCARQTLPTASYSFFNVWILGFILISIIKSIHLLVFSTVGDHCLTVTSANNSKSTSDENDTRESPTINFRSPSLNYRLWLALGRSSFTCGLMLGTIIYHLIPHIYHIPDEDFDYVYLLRATIVFFGVYLFFIVEKLLRFRFKLDEVQTDETNHEDQDLRRSSDTSIMQMGRMHATLNSSGYDEHSHNHSNFPARIPLHADSDDDEEPDLKVNQVPTKNLLNTHQHSNPLPNRKRNLILYHLINDFSNDLIYGCGLSTALAHDRFIGSILSLMIFSEGFGRHSQTISTVGRKRGLFLLLISIIFLLIGYVIGGCFIELNRQFNNNDNLFFIRTEYIYSIVYGALFYTALVTLIPEINDIGHHLQSHLKQINQTVKQRRLLKILILICQNLFLLIGVIIALILASIWRFYHRRQIFDYVCNRDSSRSFCYRH